MKLEPPPSAERRITDMFHASLVSHILVIIYSTYCLSAIEMYRGRAGKDKNLTQENRVCKIELIDMSIVVFVNFRSNSDFNDLIKFR